MGKCRIKRMRLTLVAILSLAGAILMFSIWIMFSSWLGLPFGIAFVAISMLSLWRLYDLGKRDADKQSYSHPDSTH